MPNNNLFIEENDFQTKNEMEYSDKPDFSIDNIIFNCSPLEKPSLIEASNEKVIPEFKELDITEISETIRNEIKKEVENIPVPYNDVGMIQKALATYPLTQPSDISIDERIK